MHLISFPSFRPQKLFRHSFIAVYDVYDVRTGRRVSLEPPRALLKALGPPGGGPDDFGPGGGAGGPGGPPQLPLLYATWYDIFCG